MRIGPIVVLQLLVAGILALAPLAQAEAVEHAGTGVPTSVLDADAALCCADPSPLARTTCEMPCLCLQALPAAVAELAATPAARCPPLSARGFADGASRPEPLPPKASAA